MTEVSEAGRFWESEAYDQDYLQRYPKDCNPPFPRSGVEAGDRTPA